VYWSTADVLVPIDQVSKKWVRPFDETAFPDGFTMDPEKMMKTAEGRQRLLDALPEADREVFAFEKEAVVKWLKEGRRTAREMPVSRTKRWSITILDEGAPEPKLGHVKYSLPWSREDFFKQVLTGKVSAGQLTR